MNQNTQWKKNMFASKTWKILSVSALAMMISACGGDDDDDEKVVGDPVNLTVTVTGSGQIKTKSNTIRCGEGGSDCTQTYMEVESEEFTAVPQSGHYFAGWQAAECAGVDAVCTLKISSALTGATDTAYTLKATFKPIAASAAATYTHNVLGQRTSKTVGGVTTFFIYDTAGNLIQELDSAGKPVVEMVYLEDQAVARIEKSGTTTATRYVHNDHLGTPVMMTNQERKVTWEIETSPFGEPYALYEAGIAQNSRFPGQLFDAEAGLYYNWFRYYDPAIGRYIASDPIGLVGGINTYIYGRNNPLKYADPWGLVDLEFFKAFDPAREGASKTNNPAEFTVSAHGYPGGIVDKLAENIKPEELATLIKQHPKYKIGMPVRIYACNGASPGIFAPSFAQQLAEVMPGHKIYGGSTYGWFNKDGFRGLFEPLKDNRKKPDYRKPGKWLEHFVDDGEL